MNMSSVVICERRLLYRKEFWLSWESNELNQKTKGGHCDVVVFCFVYKKKIKKKAHGSANLANLKGSPY